jgi:transcriptional regulator with XRE-family HTH domain
MAEATTLAALVGRQVRARREELALTQDELARRAGMGWTRTVVAKIERGERDALTLDEVLILSLALEVAPCSLVDTGAELVAVGPITVPARLLVAALRGEPLWAGVAGSRALVRTVIETEHGEADRKAAARLGIDLTDLGVLTHHLWGRSVTAERDRRLADQQRPDDSARTIQARRGHITRLLLDEIEQALTRE